MDFEGLYMAFFPTLYRFALSLTRDRHEAEEIVQETFFRSLRHADKLPNDADVHAWLFRVARNVHISRLRRHQREADEKALDVVPSAQDVEGQLLDQDQAHRVLAALHTLPEPYKEVFTLRALGEVNYRQIAALFGKGESWARVTYHRARLMLTDVINKEESI